MPKIRVHELAKQLNISSKEMIDVIASLGFGEKKTMNALEENEVKKITEFYESKSKAAETTKKEMVSEKTQAKKKEQPTKDNEQNKAKSQEKNKSQKPKQQEKSQEKPQEKQQEKQAIKESPKQNVKKAPEPKVEEVKYEEPKKEEPEKEEVQEEEIKIVKIPSKIMVKELAQRLDRTSSELVKLLMSKGMMVNLNQDIDFAIASEIAESFNALVEEEEEVDILQETFAEEPEKEENLTPRSPVVVVMGHVDHGKTSLLDAIRHSAVTSQEAGGITQHIGAYTVPVNGKNITFLDTPGHEAFTAMRMRGAQITDIAILVVAADDGVMPQTVEAINHAKAANVEIIVAINKIDKPGANPDRVKQELVEYGLQAEDWGGQTICVPVSALKKEGIDTLLEMVLLVAEMKELKANPNKAARGTIIEARLDKGRGPVATVLVQNGTLKVGDPVVVGSTYGKVRAMTDDKGKKLKKAGPSTPVEVLGISEVPYAGDMFYVAKSEKQARQLSETVIAKGRIDMIRATPNKVSLDDLFTQIQSGNVKDLNIVVKADVQGSVEAVRQSLEKLSNEEVRICTIHGGVGAINESDVMLAAASGAIIIGFNVRPESVAKSFAEEQKVDIRLYRVIYNAIDDIQSAMNGMLEPVYKEKVIAHAEIRQIFKSSGVGTIAGSYVLDGTFQRNCKVRVYRDNVVIYEGELASLKRFKDDVKEVREGFECGLLFNKFNDVKEGDQVEAFVMEVVPR